MSMLRFAPIALLVILLNGCLGASSALKTTRAERDQMASQARMARDDFQEGNYTEAEQLLLPLSQKLSIDQPLYQFELASAYLLDHKKDEAHQTLLAAHNSIEVFFDTKSEQKAASLWGKEADKVFKGEPYERASLYFLLALSFLEQNNVDNALAALKTGLLADSDTKENRYKSDFALLQFLAAKCHDLRGEPELRDQMLATTFTSLTSVAETSKGYAEQLVASYQQQHTPGNPPPQQLAQLCSLAPADTIEGWLKRNDIEAELAHTVAQWAAESTADINPLNFNALVVLWRGTAPAAVRSGQYGELRMISPGIVNSAVHYSVAVDTVNHAPFASLGDVNYQATTRGGREMDNVLGRQASFKGAANSGGNVLMATGAVGTGHSDADAILFASGLLLKIISAATNPQADIRYWHNLPARFDMIPLQLTAGVHSVQLTYRNDAGDTGSLEPLQWFIPEDVAVSVFHLRAQQKKAENLPDEGEETLNERARAEDRSVNGADPPEAE